MVSLCIQAWLNMNENMAIYKLKYLEHIIMHDRDMCGTRAEKVILAYRGLPKDVLNSI